MRIVLLLIAGCSMVLEIVQRLNFLLLDSHNNTRKVVGELMVA